MSPGSRSAGAKGAMGRLAVASGRCFVAWTALVMISTTWSQLAFSAEAAPPATPPATESSAAEAVPEEEQRPEVSPEIFDEALADFDGGRFAEAAAGFWGYIHFGEPSAENYEWAQFFLGECLRQLGLWHGAVQYYSLVARTRSRPEILPEVLKRLELISRRRPFSEGLVFEDLLYDSEFGFLPAQLDDWVHYVQGLYDYRNGFVDWAERHFDRVNPGSSYALRAMYVRGVYNLKHRKDDLALAMFDTIVHSPADEPEIKNRSHLALARLLFDLGEYESALKTYGEVQQIELSFEQAQLLLEKAWAAYYLQDRRRAMGLLHALDAPSYQKYFLPDVYVLRGLIYKDLCHFIPAKRVVRTFRFRFSRSLDMLRKRLELHRIPGILEAATQQGSIARRTRFLQSLEEERRRIEKYDSTWEDVELDQHLRRIYDLEIREQSRLWHEEFRKAAEEAARDLLDAEEQINLLDYEIGLDIFKRLKAEEARRTIDETLSIPYDSANVYYEFDTEYWNDELHSYKFLINSRCFDRGAKQ